MGRVCIVMRAAGARVRAVVGAGGSSEERFLTDMHVGPASASEEYDAEVELEPGQWIDKDGYMRDSWE